MKDEGQKVKQYQMLACKTNVVICCSMRDRGRGTREGGIENEFLHSFYANEPLVLKKKVS